MCGWAKLSVDCCFMVVGGEAAERFQNATSKLSVRKAVELVFSIIPINVCVDRTD